MIPWTSGSDPVVPQEERALVDPAHAAVRQHDPVLVAGRRAGAVELLAPRHRPLAVVGVDALRPDAVAARPLCPGTAEDTLDLRANPHRGAVQPVDVEGSRKRLDQGGPGWFRVAGGCVGVVGRGAAFGACHVLTAPAAPQSSGSGGA